MRFCVILLGLVLAGFVYAADPPIDPPEPESHSWYENDSHNLLPVGALTSEQILQWKVYNFNYVEYVPESDPVQEIYNYPFPLEIKVFLGDWCKDSKKHVPAFIKTMEFAGNGRTSITYINVSRDKKEPADLIHQWGIQTVPVFIVLRDGTEIGRITETPRTRVEEDLAEILAMQ